MTVRKHDWLIGLLTELENYSLLNNLPRTKKAIFDAVEITIDEQQEVGDTGNVIFLCKYRAEVDYNGKSGAVSAFAREIEDLLSEK